MHERDIAIDNIVKGLAFLIMTDLKEAAGERFEIIYGPKEKE